MIRTQGQAKKKGPDAPKPIVRWHLVLMTHSDGRVLHKADTYRGIGNRNIAEALITKGIIDKEGLREPPSGYVTVKTNPAEAMPEGGKDDKVHEMLNNAAKTAWKPGMSVPKRVNQPTHGLHNIEAREDALSEVDADLNELAGLDPDAPPEPGADFVQQQLEQARTPKPKSTKGDK